MRHLKSGKKFHRKKDLRQALIRNLMADLVLRGRIRTSPAKAKAVRSNLEKLITVARKQNISALRRLKADLPEKAANKIYYELAALYKNRPGGYLRIIQTGERKIKDGSPLAILELVKEEISEK